jgi:hypothetical protein
MIREVREGPDRKWGGDPKRFKKNEDKSGKKKKRVKKPDQGSFRKQKLNPWE